MTLSSVGIYVSQVIRLTLRTASRTTPILASVMTGLVVLILQCRLARGFLADNVSFIMHSSESISICPFPLKKKFTVMIPSGHSFIMNRKSSFGSFLDSHPIVWWVRILFSTCLSGTNTFLNHSFFADGI